MQGLQPLPSEKVDVEEREGQDDFPRRVNRLALLADSSKLFNFLRQMSSSPASHFFLARKRSSHHPFSKEFQNFEW